MVCAGLESLDEYTMATILQFPATCYPQYWAVVMAGVFVIITSILFAADRIRNPNADFISCAGVGAVATIFVSLPGTLIGFIEPAIFLEIFVVGGIFIGIWFFKK